MQSIAEGYKTSDFDIVSGKFLGENGTWPKKLTEKLLGNRKWQKRRTDFFRSEYVTDDKVVNGVKNYIFTNYIKSLSAIEGYNKIDALVIRYNIEQMKVRTLDVNQICRFISANFIDFRTWIQKEYPKSSRRLKKYNSQ